MSTNLNLPFSCEDGHDFEMAGEGYYKNDENGNRIPNVVFRMIFCLKCGANLEIIVADRRPIKEEKINVRTSSRRRNRKSNARNNI